MKDKINKIFIREIFSVQKSTCKLKETEQYNYEVDIKWAKGKEMLIIKPEEIKSRSTYIQTRAQPKDCDYILIDIEDKNIFFIELKLSPSTSTALQVSKQLKAGELWLKHIFYIIGMEGEYSHFNKFFIHSVFNARMNISSKFLEHDMHGVYKINGPRLNLLPIITKNY